MKNGKQVLDLGGKKDRKLMRSESTVRDRIQTAFAGGDHSQLIACSRDLPAGGRCAAT